MGLATFLACILTRAVSPALVVSSRLVSHCKLQRQTKHRTPARSRSPEPRPASGPPSGLRPLPNKSLSVTVRQAPKGALISIIIWFSKTKWQANANACLHQAKGAETFAIGGRRRHDHHHRPPASSMAPGRAHACVRVRQKHAACRTSLAGRLSWP
jgi:hypothetical protein